MKDYSKLQNLFTTNSRLVAYNKNSKKRTEEETKLADINNDGKVNSTDKKIINETIKSIKENNPFDFNNDGKTDISDWILLNDDIDLDGDGKISDEEKAFIENQKKSIKSTVAKSVKSEKYTGEFDGKYYSNGELATGVYNNTYYKNGVVASGTVKSGNTTADYKNGVLQYSITNNNEKDYPKASTNTIQFSQDKNVTLQVGERAVINSDGSVKVTSKDGKTVTAYDSNGKVLSKTITANNKTATVKYNDDGTITQTEQNAGSKDKTILTFDSNWKKQKTVTVKYNDDGTITQTEQNAGSKDKTILTFDSNWQKQKTVSVKYNDDGTITQTEQNANTKDKTILTFDSDWKKQKTVTVKYNDDGTITQTEQNAGSKDKTILTFDSNWQKQKTVTVKYNDDESVTETEYDANWKQTAQNTYYPDEYYLSFLEEMGYDTSGLLCGVSSFDKTTGEEISYPDNFKLTDNIKSDIKILMNAHEAGLKAGETGSAEYTKAYNDYISSQMVKDYTKSDKSDADILKETSVGDVLEKSDGLYVNDNGKIVKLNITKEQYLELFPPVTRYDTQQVGIGDCYFVAGVLQGLLNNQNTYAKMLQLFDIDEETGDVTINFTGNLAGYPVTFKNGELNTPDSMVDGKDVTQDLYHGTQSTGSKAIQYLEQAYALATFANESNKEIDEIDIDEAFVSIIGGYQDMAVMDVLSIDDSSFISGYSLSDEDTEYISDFLSKLSSQEVKNLEEAIELFKQLPLSFEDSQKLNDLINNISGLNDLSQYFGTSALDILVNININDFSKDQLKEYSLDNIADKVNSGELIAYCSCAADSDAMAKYNLALGMHAYKIEKIDSEDKMVYIVNPWQCGMTVKMPYEDFKKYFNNQYTLLDTTTI